MSLLQKRLIVVLGIFLIALTLLIPIFLVVSLVRPAPLVVVGPEDTMPSTLERTLTGSVLEWNQRESFLRLAVANEAIYSIFLHPDAVITEGDVSVNKANIDPLLPVVVEVVARPKGEPYDFDAKTVRIPVLSDLSEEERAARLHMINEMMLTQ